MHVSAYPMSPSSASRRVVNFMGWRHAALLFSGLLLVIAVVAMAQRGINYGIDFLGGLKLTYNVAGTTEISDGMIVAALDTAGISAQVQRFGGDEGVAPRFLIKVKQPDSPPAELVAAITATLQQQFGETVVLEGEETVGPRVGSELRVRGVKTILYILLALLLYVGFRFDFHFAPGAMIATAHDVVITMGVLVLLGVEFNLTILAAILTIAGYSINDTIVIYDRIRERAKEINHNTIAEVINRSLTETLSRTVVTGISTLIALLVLFFVAGGDIHDFALTFIVGIVFGTYSSLFVASPVYLWAYRQWPPK